MPAFRIDQKPLAISVPGHGSWVAPGRYIVIPDRADPLAAALRAHGGNVVEIHESEVPKSRAWPVGFGSDHTHKERNSAPLPVLKGRQVVIVGRGKSALGVETRYPDAVRVAVNPGAWPDKRDGNGHTVRSHPPDAFHVGLSADANYFKKAYEYLLTWDKPFVAQTLNRKFYPGTGAFYGLIDTVDLDAPRVRQSAHWAVLWAAWAGAAEIVLAGFDYSGGPELDWRKAIDLEFVNGVRAARPDAPIWLDPVCPFKELAPVKA